MRAARRRGRRPPSLRGIRYARESREPETSPPCEPAFGPLVVRLRRRALHEAPRQSNQPHGVGEEGEREEGAVTQRKPQREPEPVTGEIDQKGQGDVLDTYGADEGHRTGRQPGRRPPKRQQRQQVGEEYRDTEELQRACA